MAVRSLSVLLSTIGLNGMARVSAMHLPRHPSVTYVIVWQMPGMTHNAAIPMALRRSDVKVILSDTKGLSVSRNIAINASDASICLIADDDTVFLPGAFDVVLATFATADSPDVALFRIQGKKKIYPSESLRIRHRLPRGYWVTSSEIAFLTQSVKGRLSFRTRFGLGAPRFTAAEEAFFIADAMRLGLKINMIPAEICRQPVPSSGERPYAPDGGFAASQGAYIRYVHGIVPGLPRLALFAWRTHMSRKAPLFHTLKHAFQGFVCKTSEML